MHCVRYRTDPYSGGRDDTDRSPEVGNSRQFDGLEKNSLPPRGPGLPVRQGRLFFCPEQFPFHGSSAFNCCAAAAGGLVLSHARKAGVVTIVLTTAMITSMVNTLGGITPRSSPTLMTMSSISARVFIM